MEVQQKTSCKGTCLQAVPGFDAKGIETVRRDTCPAVAKTMERSLRLLFATRDLSEVLPHLHHLYLSPSCCIHCRVDQHRFAPHLKQCIAVHQLIAGMYIPQYLLDAATYCISSCCGSA